MLPLHHAPKKTNMRIIALRRRAVNHDKMNELTQINERGIIYIPRSDMSLEIAIRLLRPQRAPLFRCRTGISVHRGKRAFPDRNRWFHRNADT